MNAQSAGQAQQAAKAPAAPKPRQAAIAALSLRGGLLHRLDATLSARINGNPSNDLPIYSVANDFRGESQAIMLRLPMLQSGDAFRAPTGDQMLRLQAAARALQEQLDDPEAEVADLIAAGRQLLATYSAGSSVG